MLCFWGAAGFRPQGPSFVSAVFLLKAHLMLEIIGANVGHEKNCGNSVSFSLTAGTQCLCLPLRGFLRRAATRSSVARFGEYCWCWDVKIPVVIRVSILGVRSGCPRSVLRPFVEPRVFLT